MEKKISGIVYQYEKQIHKKQPPVLRGLYTHIRKDISKNQRSAVLIFRGIFTSMF